MAVDFNLWAEPAEMDLVRMHLACESWIQHHQGYLRQAIPMDMCPTLIKQTNQ